MNSSSQTASDIAKFWGHRHIADLLNRTDDGCQRVLPGSDRGPPENYFSRETLDRLSAKRTDGVWLETKQRDSDSVYLLFSKLTPMVSSSRDQEDAAVGGRGGWFSLVTVQSGWLKTNVFPFSFKNSSVTLSVFSRRVNRTALILIRNRTRPNCAASDMGPLKTSSRNQQQCSSS